MKHIIPSNNFIQTNRSNKRGNLWSTKNIDLQSNLGAIKLAPRLRLNTSTDDQSNLTTKPVAFKFFGRIHTIAGTRIFVGGTLDNTVFVPDIATASQTTYDQGSDLEIFNGILFSTTGTEIWSLDAVDGTWTRRGGASSISGSVHSLTYFKKFNRLYVVASATTVSSLDTSYPTLPTSGDYFLNITSPAQQEVITCLKSTSESVWIGTGVYLNETGRGKIYQWDGISNQITREYKLNAAACMAITIIDDIPWAMDSNGVLLRFNGSTFEEVGRLPENMLVNSSYSTANGFIHPNGLKGTKNGTVLANIKNLNNDSGGTIAENIPSGVWEWSRDNGFVHKYSVSYTPVGSTTITDFGQNRIAAAGALEKSEVLASTSGKNGSLLIGASYYQNASTSVAGIFIDDFNNTIKKIGYFVTNWLESSEIEDVWDRIWITFRKFLNSGDKITLKYRTSEDSPIEATITWVDTTHFTTTTDISAYGNTATGFDGTYGGEVEILQGTGGGACVHITNVSLNGGTYTVTIDNAVTGVTTGTAKARFQKWIKLLPEITGQVLQYGHAPIDVNDVRIQFKAVMEFTGDDEVYKLAIVSNPNIKINA